MSQVIHISEELYRKIAEQAQQHGQPVDDFVEQQLTAAVAKPLPATGGDENECNGELPKGGLFDIIGMFSEPIEGLPPDWKERHDEIIAEEAMDPHADTEE